jgi:hypothetical protein
MAPRKRRAETPKQKPAKGKKGPAKAKNKPARRQKRPGKLGFTIRADLPTAAATRKADVTVLHKDGTVVTSDRADLGDGKERGRLARRLEKRFGGDAGQWERALEQTYLEAVQLRAIAREAAQNRPASPERPENPDFWYRVDAGRICMPRTFSGEEVLIPLCNFNALITEQVCVDDGSGETSLHFTVEGALANGTALPPAPVKAADFTAMNWPLTVWGVKAIVAPGQGSKDHLRVAIQSLSGRAVSKTVYTHTGWRRFGQDWAYLHAAGAVTAAGVELPVSVKLEGPLARFELPPPPAGDELREAVRASLRLLRLSSRIMAPVLGVVYRAVLGPADCSLHLVGHTGRGKSELLALGQQHLGAGMDRLSLPGNWLSTGNALEGLAFLAKDTPLVIDDFKPGGAKADIDRLHQLADRVLRAQGNSSGRGRCRADGSVRAQRPPRGMILSNGEDVPRGESLRARLFVLHVEQGEVDVTALTPYQRDAAGGRYAAAMAGFLGWLAARYDQVRADLPGERAALRDQAMAAHGHARTPGIVADLAVGWKYFLAFATEAGALTHPERDQIAADVWGALIQGAAQQEADLTAQDPANRFLALLAAAVASGRAHLADRLGTAPATDPEAWGWQRRAGNDPGTVWVPLGKQVGWVEGDALYLDPEASFAEAQRLGDEQGERLPVSQRQLHKRLKDRGLLAGTEAGRLTYRLVLQGRERAVLHLRTASLIPQKSGFSGHSGQTPESPKTDGPDWPFASPTGNGTSGGTAGGPSRGPDHVAPNAPKTPISESDEVVL